MKNKIKMFVFDMGEVLIKNTNVIDEISKYLKISHEEFKFYALKAKIDFLQIGKISSIIFWNNFTKESNIEVGSDLFEKFFKPEKIKDMYHLINQLNNKYGVVCGTNTIESHYNFLKNGDFYSVFKEIYASNNIGYAKPHKEFFEYIIKKEKVKPEEIFFIDDDVQNIKTAERLNINSFFFIDYKSLEEKLKYLKLL